MVEAKQSHHLTEFIQRHTKRSFNSYVFKSDDSLSSGDEAMKALKLNGQCFSHSGECVDKLTDDDVPATEKLKASFNPLEVMTEVFY